jgi:hypothetical protein
MSEWVKVMIDQTVNHVSHSTETPLVFSTPFWRSYTWRHLTLYLTMVVIGFLRPYSVILQVVVLLIGISAAFYGLGHHRGQRVLRLKKAGFQCVKGFDWFTINWLDASSFDVQQRRVGLFNRHVVTWSYEDVQPMRMQARNPSKELTSKEDWIVAYDYGLSPHELAKKMNECRELALQRATEKQ